MAMRPTGWRRLVPSGATEPSAPAPPDAPASDPTDDFARIERGVEMSGRLVTERPLRVEGEFSGEIESASAVIVTETGAIEAPIRARSVEIRGAVVGDVQAAREVVIHPSGRLHGDVEAPSLVVMRGAFFNGRTRMYRPERVAHTDASAVESESEPTATTPTAEA
ncbi:MAG TPA: polymer-forming cytoskeletal protein [Myxococcota bacterium]|nr:polymer-forming cytoskeletal protein [Myxococcota bacterium]